MMDAISYCDGAHTLLDIADLIGAPAAQVLAVLEPLIAAGLVTVC